MDTTKPEHTQFVLGIDLGGTKMALATAWLDGTVIATQRLATVGARGAEQALRRAIESARQLVETTAQETGATLASIGLATFGVAREEGVLMAPNVPGWEHLAIPQALRSAFPGVPHAIVNDVKAATGAELRWGALQGCRTAIYLNLGTGIAVGLVVEGRVHDGANGAAGEIGYNLRSLHEEDGITAGHTPLEEYIGGGAIGARATRRFGQPLTAQDLLSRAADNPEMQAFLNETLVEVAFHLTNLTIALDPERVAIGGGLMGSAELILPYLQAHMRRFVPFPPPVVAATLIHDAGLVGAIAAAVAHVEATA